MKDPITCATRYTTPLVRSAI